MSINHIVTPLDSAVLDSKEQYKFYHSMVDFALKECIVGVQSNGLCTNREIIFFKQYCDLLLYSIEAMRIKYMYDDEENMKVDLTESGFPNYLEFRYLFNDLSLKENYVKKLKDVEQMKSDFLDLLLKKKVPVGRQRLYKAASVVYYTTVEKKFIYNRFVQGKLIASPQDRTEHYMTSWSFYDLTHNRPFICFLYFNYKGKNIDDYKHKIYDVLKTTADRKMPLEVMAYGIDRKLPEIMPKHLKCIDLGPLHNVFAKDENILTHNLLTSISKQEVPLESYALSLKIDEVFSVKEFEEGGYFSKQVLQQWGNVVKQNYLFAPHRIIQMFYNTSQELMNALALPPIQVARLNKN